MYKEALKLDIKAVGQLEGKIGYPWNEEVDAFDFSKDSPEERMKISYEILKNKFILAPASYLSNQDYTALSFHYLFREIPLPFSPQA